jgi:hypothetical protein
MKILSIIDVINRNNKKINNNLYFELENHKIIINNFKNSIDSINLNNDINKNIMTTIINKIDKLERNYKNIYFMINFIIVFIAFIYINLLYIYIK